VNSSRENTITRHLPASVRRMFDTIAPRYDLLNHLLSFGLDIRWRKKAVKFLAVQKEGKFLDIGAGTGDVSMEIMKAMPAYVIGADFSLNMLDIFRKKMGPGETRASLVSCDALSLPFRDEIFDGTIVAFGIRNFRDRLLAMREMLRVLKPGGISVILELSRPRKPIVSQLYWIYSRALLPLVGRIISRHNSAYRYLPESIRGFPLEEEFLPLMVKAGYNETKAYTLTFGAATIYVGRKNKV